MKLFHRSVAAVIVLLIMSVGCSSETPSLAGEWEGKVVGKNLKEPQAQMYNGLLGFKLKVEADSQFRLSSTSSQVFVGKIIQTGKRLSFVKESYNGKKGADMGKELLGSTVQFSVGSKPMVATYDAKADKLTLDCDANPDLHIEFVRVVAPKATGPSTVTAAEARYVGKYVSVLNQPEPTPSGPPAELHLLQDNKYFMNLVVPTEGTWKLDKGRLVLIDSASKDSKDPRDQFILDIDHKGDLVDKRKDQFALPFRFVKK